MGDLNFLLYTFLQYQTNVLAFDMKKNYFRMKGKGIDEKNSLLAVGKECYCRTQPSVTSS